MTIPFEKISLCPLFAGIVPDAQESLVRSLHPLLRQVSGGTCILAEGEPLPGVGILLSGSAEISKQTPQGERMLLDTLSEGGLFGEVGAFLRPPVAPADVVAVRDCAVLFFPPDELTASTDERVAILLRNLLATLAEKSFLLNRRLGYLMHKSLRTRVIAFLYDHWNKTRAATFSIGMGRLKMADTLGVTRPALSREIGRLRDEGFLSFYGESFKILDHSLWKMLK